MCGTQYTFHIIVKHWHLNTTAEKVSTMNFQIALSFLVAVIHAINCQTDPTYVITASTQVHPLSSYTVHVSLHNANSSMAVKATIYGNPGQSVSVGDNILPGVSKEIKLQIGDWTAANLLLIEGSGAITFNESKPLNFNPKRSSVFIQTNKPIYQPGQKIQFRVFVIDAKLKPIAALVNTYITDPKGNRIKQYLNSPLDKGVFSEELQLSDRPLLGDWNITTTIGDVKATQLVAVEEYVLPKYQVTVIPPPYATYNETSVPIRVTAKYTYGKPVQGSVMLVVSNTCQQPGSSECLFTPNIIETLNKNGEVALPLDLSQIRFPQDQYQKQTALTIIISITEEQTGKVMNKKLLLTIYPHKEKITVVPTPDKFIPGLPMKIEVALSDQDNRPMPNPNAPITIAITYQTSGENFSLDQVIDPVPISGIVSFNLYPSKSFTSIHLKARYKAVESVPLSISAVKSLNNAYIIISLTNEKKSLLVGDKVTVTINSTFSISQLHYEIVSKRDIIETKMLQFPPTNTYAFPITLTHAMTPRSTIIVYVVTENREILVDSINYYVDGFFLTPVNLQATPNETQPGDSIQVLVKTNPFANVYLLGVDQSVLILKNGNDITRDEVETEYSNLENSGLTVPTDQIIGIGGRTDPIWRSPTNDVPGTFKEASVFFMTNGAYYQNPVDIASTAVPVADPTAVPVADPTAVPVGDPAAPERKTMSNNEGIEGDTTLQKEPDKGLPVPAAQTASRNIRILKYFPETFIWEKVVAGSDGNAKFNTTAPDTITSWDISSIAMDQNTGMGIPDFTSKVTVFRRFFVSLNLPYSVVRGETLQLQCLVFNYLKDSVEVNVILSNENDDFIFTGNSTNATSGIIIKPDESASVIFSIIMKTIGYVKIKVSALTINQNLAGDIIQRELLSKPEGTTKYFNRAVLVDLRQTHAFSLFVPIEVPSNVVPDSKRVEVSVIGDIIGATITSIDTLLQMPIGCGEQNMLKLVPNIVVAGYLTAIGELTDERKAKAVSHMESGYQAELTFKHTDGSYSAFGESDLNGSTWLTAYVVMSFHQCKPYITVSDDIINQGLQFLQSKQNPDGTFIESRIVHHKEMLGGTTTYGLSMVAYIAIAFLEIANPQYAPVVSSAITALEARLPNVVGAYELALITYALHLASSTAKDSAFEKLKNMSTTDGGLMYWNAATLQKSSSYDTSSISSLNVETTAYCLLIYANRSLISEATPIISWLVQQKNEFGGFASTQDTVVALRALSKFPKTSGSVSIKFKYNGTEKQYFVTKDKSLLLQQDILPADTTQVEISATGDGTCVAQVAWSYNIFNMTTYNTFSINATTYSKTPATYMLTVCVLYTLTHGDSSNMAIIQLNSLSGYTFDRSNRTQADMIEYAFGDTQTNLYYYTTTNSTTCVTIPASKSCDVNNLKEAEVKVYDYYQPGNNAKAGYII